MQEKCMPTLQVRDLPQELYNKLSYLAEKEHRSLAQETIVLLKEGVERKLNNRDRRRKLIASFNGLGITNPAKLPSPADLVREDRETR
jgi:plasmid stability protein